MRRTRCHPLVTVALDTVTLLWQHPRHMTTTTSERRTFADKLRTEIDRRHTPAAPFGARTVARLIVNGNPGRDLEPTRRAIVRWLKGAEPTQANRDLVTDALGIERGSLDADADEEEDPAMRQAYRLFVDLMGQIDTAQQKKNARKRAERATT